jgi:hypothetical protein
MSRRLSASSFRSLLHCPHALFLDHHGDPNLKTELGEFEQYLLDDEKRFEQEFLAGQEYVQPEYPEGNLNAGAEARAGILVSHARSLSDLMSHIDLDDLSSLHQFHEII